MQEHCRFLFFTHSFSQCPVSLQAGSAHIKSLKLKKTYAIMPEVGGSLKRSKWLICPTSFSSGEMPPCTAKIFPPINAPNGSQSKDSQICSYSQLSNFASTSIRKLKDVVMCRVSWLPLSIVIAFGQFNFIVTYSTYFQSIQQHKYFQGERASVHIVAQEHITIIIREVITLTVLPYPQVRTSSSCRNTDRASPR